MLISYQILFNDVSELLPQYATLKAIGYESVYLIRVILEQAIFYAVAGFLPAWLVCAVLFKILGEITLLPLRMSISLTVSVVILSQCALCQVCLRCGASWQPIPQRFFYTRAGSARAEGSAGAETATTKLHRDEILRVLTDLATSSVQRCRWMRQNASWTRRSFWPREVARRSVQQSMPLCFDFYMIEILPTTGPLGVPRHNFLGSSSSPVSLSSSGERVQHMFESHAAC
jgi:hypothetical protein